MFFKDETTDDIFNRCIKEFFNCAYGSIRDEKQNICNKFVEGKITKSELNKLLDELDEPYEEIRNFEDEFAKKREKMKEEYAKNNG